MKCYVQHRTNYWGNIITPSELDNEIDFGVIWAQVADRYRGCCPGFGERCIHLRNKHFEEDMRYRVYKVSEQEGRNTDHYFYKFVAIQEGKRGYGRQRCLDKGWEFVGDVNGSSARSDLKELLMPYKDNDDYEVIHLHIGLDIEELATRY